MKFKMLEQGNDGFQHFNVGDEVNRPSEWLVRSIHQGGVVEPMDEEAKAFAERFKTQE